MDRTPFSRAPLYETLQQDYFQRASRYHVPGHKGGRGFSQETAGLLKDIMKIDYTEVNGLDDLHHPEGIIKEAQELAALCFGAEHTYFLVNGSTVGNLAMIQTMCQRNDLLLVQRNVHKSVIHGLMLAGARAVFLSPQTDVATGLPVGVDEEELSHALDTYPEAKAVLLSNPNYYGMGIDLKRIADRVHSYGKPLLVDEAHGAHYGFHPDLPQSALAAGADVVVQSTHKMLTALTMGSMLHIQGNRIDRERLAFYLSVLQSSSPSYPIMASLDWSRRLLHREGARLFNEGLNSVRALHEEMLNFPVFDTLEEGYHSKACESLDPFKVLIWDATGTLSGFRLQQELEERDCLVEMADPRHVLLLYSLASSQSDTDKLLQALAEITDKFSLDKKENSRDTANIEGTPFIPPLSAPVSFDCSLLPSRQRKKEHMRLEEAAGYRSAEMIIPYPPGIPVLYPGELITKDIIRYLKLLSDEGAKFQGSGEGKPETISVLGSS